MRVDLCELLRGPCLGWSTRGAAPVGSQARLAGRSWPAGDQNVAPDQTVGKALRFEVFVQLMMGQAHAEHCLRNAQERRARLGGDASP